MDALPLTTNGKIDRAALPEPGLATPRPPAADRRGGLEQRLAAVWAAELGVAAVLPDATFFELGGHSLSAIRLVNRVRDELGVRLDVADFLRSPTVRGLATLLAPQLQPSDVEVSVPASRSQLVGYRATMASDNPSLLTVATRFALDGKLDVPALHRALTALTLRHPALRTRIREVDGVPYQEVMIAGEAPLKIVDASGGDLEALVLAAAEDAADITAAGTFRATLLRIADCRAELLLTVHHSFSDGWSTGVLIRDLGELYRAAVSGESPDLPVLTTSYVDYTAWESAFLADLATQAAITEWADYVEAVGAGPLLFPPDLSGGGELTGHGAVHTAVLAQELVTAIEAVAAGQGATTFAVLIAAFAALAQEVTGVPATAFLCGVANRPESRFEDVVGCFTHLSWVVVPVAEAASFAGLVAIARDAIWRCLALQAIPARVLKEAAGGPFAENLPRTMLELFTTPLPSLTLAGIEPAPPIDVDLPVARGEQTWALKLTQDGALHLTLEYSTDLYQPEGVATRASRFLEILTAGVADPDSRPWRTP